MRRLQVAVINGSPAGNRGISANYVEYLRMRFPEHDFVVVEAAKKIRKIERDPARWEAIMGQLEAADAVLWVYPVYVMLLSAQLKRFVELLLERGGEGVLAGKVASSISTSAHHYDHTAHDYMQGVSCDLGMTYVRGFSAGQKELLTEEGRRDLIGYARDFFLHADGEPGLETPVPPVKWTPAEYSPSMPEVEDREGTGKIVVISDAGLDDRNLRGMIEVFSRSVPAKVDLLQLSELRMVGGCLDCMKCTNSGKCGYKDDYAQAFDERVRTADIVIFAGAVRDRFLSARMKTFIDRYFSNGHRPVLQGKAMGFIVSGPLAQLATLREVIEAHMEVALCQRIGIVTDEDPDSGAITGRVQGLARTAARWLMEPWFTPRRTSVTWSMTTGGSCPRITVTTAIMVFTTSPRKTGASACSTGCSS